MDEVTIRCPECGAVIPITDALKESIRNEMEEEYNKKLKAEVEKRVNSEIAKKQMDLEDKYRAVLDELEVKSKRLEDTIKRESDERRRR
ncbi:MAG: hypothetical protein QXO44_01540, partial [Thermoplasmatales archaeon]